MDINKQEGQKQGLNFDQIIQKNRNEQLMKEYNSKLKNAEYLVRKQGGAKAPASSTGAGPSHWDFTAQDLHSLWILVREFIIAE